MASSPFDEAITNLGTTTDPHKLLRLLINIRKGVEWPRNRDNVNKLCENGLNYLITFLCKTKKCLVDVSLSILGNCCLDQKFSKNAIVKYNILSSLNQILKRYPDEDSINGRVFRIIGNLCQHSTEWANLIVVKKTQIVLHIVKLLNDVSKDESEKISEATVIMGLRCLRELVNTETLEALVKELGVLKVVGMLLIKYGSKWREDKRSETIVTNIIKLVQEYSKYHYYPVIMEMRSTELGDSLEVLGNIVMLAPRQVIKIVMNLLKICKLKSDLPIPQIFNSFIEVLTDDALGAETFSRTYEDCIRCVCCLLEHPGNRLNDRCGDSIAVLINIIKHLKLEHSNNKIECCILIISTLAKCNYDSVLMREQIRCDIITVIAEKLVWAVGGLETLTIPHKIERKRRTHSEPEWIELQNDGSSCEEDTEGVYSRPLTWSPSSSDSDKVMSWTSGLSPVSSPRSQVALSGSDSDDYSPVCSDAEGGDVPMEPPEDLEETEQKSVDGGGEDGERKARGLDESEECRFDTAAVDGEPKVDLQTMTRAKSCLILESVRLINELIRFNTPTDQLIGPVLLALVKAACLLELPGATKSVTTLIQRIVELHDYLLPLMQTEFIPKIDELGKLVHGSWCSKCRQMQWTSQFIIKKMTKSAESEAGKGDIAHQLLRGDNEIKYKLVLVIPYVIRAKPILAKLMVNCGGLEILMKLLREDSPLRERSIKALCSLATKKLGIPNPRNLNLPCNNPLASFTIKPEFRMEPPHVVTFKLDDGSILRADRDKLSRNSDFFSCLLDGHFKESGQDVIVLHNVVNKSFRYLLSLIKCDIDRNSNFEFDLLTHLDVIALCDRFLMPSHCVYLTDYVEKYRLSSETIPLIYQWSMESKTNLLRIECIAFALVGCIRDTDRVDMFKNLFRLGYTEELIEDIKNLLIRYILHLR